jgi:hypothetical protein
MSTMPKVILTAPVDKTVQKDVHLQAKKHNIPIRVLCAMLIEHGLEDIAKGRLEVTRPSLVKS